MSKCPMVTKFFCFGLKSFSFGLHIEWTPRLNYTPSFLTSVIFVNEYENGEKWENNEFVNEN